MSNRTSPAGGTSSPKPRIAFFDYPDVFEDFYAHYGITQRAFATSWDNTGNHAFASLLQQELGDVTWYTYSLKPEVHESQHGTTGCRVRILRSTWLHRQLWSAFYESKPAWRWRSWYPWYATIASYISLPSYDFFQEMRRSKPDFFFVQDYATGRFDTLLLMSRILGVPLIARHSGSSPDQYVGALAKRWTIPRADLLIASSEAEQRLLAERFHVSPERLTVILTPIDTEVYKPRDRRQACARAGLSSDRRYLLFVGRLQDSVKRVSKLIRDFGRLRDRFPDVDLLIVGDGPDGEMLRKLAAEQASGRVRFVGWIGESDAKTDLYAAAECLVLTSRSEGFPTVVGEAMACGTPVLATDVGGVKELVVENQTGWLLPADDLSPLLGRLQLVLQDPQSILGFRPRARALAERRVSHAVVGNALKECFREVAEPAHRSAKNAGSQQP